MVVAPGDAIALISERTYRHKGVVLIVTADDPDNFGFTRVLALTSACTLRWFLLDANDGEHGWQHVK